MALNEIVFTIAFCLILCSNVFGQVQVGNALHTKEIIEKNEIKSIEVQELNLIDGSSSDIGTIRARLEYDKSGNLLKSSIFENGFLDRWYEYSYDEFNNVIVDSRFNIITDQSNIAFVGGPIPYNIKDSIPDTLIQKWVNQFDENKNKISIIHYGNNEELIHSYIQKFNEKNDLIQQIFTTSSGQNGITRFRYDYQNTNLISVVTFGLDSTEPDSKSIYKYNEFDKLVETRNYEFNYPYIGDSNLVGMTTFNYNALNNLIQELKIEYHSWNLRFKLKKTTKTYFDDLGNVAKVDEIDNWNHSHNISIFNIHGDITSQSYLNKRGKEFFGRRNQYKYSDAGLMEETKLFDRKEEILGSSCYKYSSSGLIIEQKERNGKDETILIKQYKYTYY